MYEYEPVYELLLWNSCNNNCRFCWQKARKEKYPDKFVSPEETLKPILLAQKFVHKLAETEYEDFHVLFMGGELFDRVLPKASEEAFHDLAVTCTKYMKESRIHKVFFNSNLLYSNTDLLQSILSVFQISGLINRVQLTTSYDFEYRFAKPEYKIQVVKNMINMSKNFPNMARLANCIMTDACYKKLYSEPEFMDNFLLDTGFRLNPIPYIRLDDNMAITRKESLNLLRILQRHNPLFLEKYIKGYSSKGKKYLWEYNGKEFLPVNAKDTICGHNVNFRNVYKDSNVCFVCDLLKLANSMEIFT